MALILDYQNKITWDCRKKKIKDNIFQAIIAKRSATLATISSLLSNYFYFEENKEIKLCFKIGINLFYIPTFNKKRSIITKFQTLTSKFQNCKNFKISIKEIIALNINNVFASRTYSIATTDKIKTIQNDKLLIDSSRNFPKFLYEFSMQPTQIKFTDSKIYDDSNFPIGNKQKKFSSLYSIRSYYPTTPKLPINLQLLIYLPNLPLENIYIKYLNHLYYSLYNRSSQNSNKNTFSILPTTIRIISLDKQTCDYSLHSSFKTDILINTNIALKLQHSLDLLKSISHKYFFYANSIKSSLIPLISSNKKKNLEFSQINFKLSHYCSYTTPFQNIKKHFKNNKIITFSNALLNLNKIKYIKNISWKYSNYKVTIKKLNFNKNKIPLDSFSFPQNYVIYKNFKISSKENIRYLPIFTIHPNKIEYLHNKFAYNKKKLTNKNKFSKVLKTLKLIYRTYNIVFLAHQSLLKHTLFEIILQQKSISVKHLPPIIANLKQCYKIKLVLENFKDFRFYNNFNINTLLVKEMFKHHLISLKPTCQIFHNKFKIHYPQIKKVHNQITTNNDRYSCNKLFTDISFYFMPPAKVFFKNEIIGILIPILSFRMLIPISKKISSIQYSKKNVKLKQHFEFYEYNCKSINCRTHRSVIFFLCTISEVYDYITERYKKLSIIRFKLTTPKKYLSIITTKFDLITKFLQFFYYNYFLQNLFNLQINYIKHSTKFKFEIKNTHSFKLIRSTFKIYKNNLENKKHIDIKSNVPCDIPKIQINNNILKVINDEFYSKISDINLKEKKPKFWLLHTSKELELIVKFHIYSYISNYQMLLKTPIRGKRNPKLAKQFYFKGIKLGYTIPISISYIIDHLGNLQYIYTHTISSFSIKPSNTPGTNKFKTIKILHYLTLFTTKSLQRNYRCFLNSYNIRSYKDSSFQYLTININNKKSIFNTIKTNIINSKTTQLPIESKNSLKNKVFSHILKYYKINLLKIKSLKYYILSLHSKLTTFLPYQVSQNTSKNNSFAKEKIKLIRNKLSLQNILVYLPNVLINKILLYYSFKIFEPQIHFSTYINSYFRGQIYNFSDSLGDFINNIITIERNIIYNIFVSKKIYELIILKNPIYVYKLLPTQKVFQDKVFRYIYYSITHQSKMNYLVLSKGISKIRLNKDKKTSINFVKSSEIKIKNFCFYKHLLEKHLETGNMYKNYPQEFIVKKYDFIPNKTPLHNLSFESPHWTVIYRGIAKRLIKIYFVKLHLPANNYNKEIKFTYTYKRLINQNITYKAAYDSYNKINNIEKKLKLYFIKSKSQNLNFSFEFTLNSAKKRKTNIMHYRVKNLIKRIIKIYDKLGSKMNLRCHTTTSSYPIKEIYLSINCLHSKKENNNVFYINKSEKPFSLSVKYHLKRFDYTQIPIKDILEINEDKEAYIKLKFS